MTDMLGVEYPALQSVLVEPLTKVEEETLQGIEKLAFAIGRAPGFSILWGLGGGLGITVSFLVWLRSIGEPLFSGYVPAVDIAYFLGGMLGWMLIVFVVCAALAHVLYLRPQQRRHLVELERWVADARSQSVLAKFREFRRVREHLKRVRLIAPGTYLESRVERILFPAT